MESINIFDAPSILHCEAQRILNQCRSYTTMLEIEHCDSIKIKLETYIGIPKKIFCSFFSELRVRSIIFIIIHQMRRK